MVNNAKFSVDEASLRYQALTKLADLSEDVASLRNPKKSVDKTLQATKIRLWLKALDLKNYLSREQRERIWYALICLSDVYDFPVAPVLSSVPRPAILLGNEYPSIITGLSNKVDRPGDTMTGDLNFTGAGINTADYVQFNTAYNNGIVEGRMQWNDVDGTLEMGLPGSNILADLVANHEKVVNKTGSTLLRGKIVYINGNQGNRPTVTYASNANEAGSSKTFAILEENINNNGSGYVMTAGLFRDINTSAYSAGQSLYLGTNGDITGTKPSAPAHMVSIGKVIDVGVTGSIYVTIINGFELNELHDVKITTPTNGVTLKYNSSTSLWENTTTPLVTGTGVINEIAYWDTTATIASLPTATYPSLTELSYVKGVTSGIQSQLNSKVPVSRLLTINGTSYDLSANRTWSVGTVTDVGLNVPTGFTVSNSPVTSAGNLSLGFAAGYSLPTTASQANWDTAYGWGNHATAGYQLTSQKGLANGYASLDSAGKVPITQLPSSIMEYKGTWNASTNTPTLANGTGDNGDVYRVTVAGTQNLGSGSISFEVGDYIIYNGTIWEKSDTTDAVASVFGRTGVVTAQSGDYTTAQITESGNLFFTNARARQAVSLTTTGTSGAATYDNSTGIFNIPQYQSALTNPVTGTGTNNEIAYFNATGSTIASLSTATYPSLTELSYVKGVTSSIQTQLNGKQATLTNPVTGTGTSGYVTYWNGTNSVTGEANLFWDATNDRLGIGTVSPPSKLLVNLTTNENVSIGSLSSIPTGRTLILQTTSSGGSIETYSSITSGYVNTLINPNGANVLIGTTSDSGERLQVSGTMKVTGAATFSSSVTAVNGIFKNSGVPALQLYRDVDVTSVGPASQGIEFAARNGANFVTGAAIYGALENPATTGYLVFQTLTGGSLTTKARLDSSGNLGLGVTPSAWISTWKTIQGNSSGSFAVASADNGMYLMSNAYYNTSGNPIYTTSNYSTMYQQISGGHYWYYTGSGTAGNTITFTQAMTLGSSGVLTIKNLEGTGNRLVGADSSGNLSSITIGSGLSLSSGTLSATGGSSGTVTASPNGASSQVAYFTSGTNITGSNNFTWDATNSRLGVGNTTPLHKLHVTQAVDGNYPTLGTGKGAIFIAGDTNLYGMYLGINTTTGDGFIQTMRNNSATAYNLILNSAGGNVGIGTTLPYDKLEVNGAIAATGGSNGNVSQGHATIINVSSGISYLTAVDWGAEFKPLVVEGKYLEFKTGTGTTTTKMIIDNGGNVGIGTASPSEKLHVNGNIYLQGVGNYLHFDTDGTAKSVSQFTANLYEFHILNGRGNSSRFILGNQFVSLGTSGTQMFYINTGSGNIGVGNVNPAAKLHVGTTASDTGTQTVRISTAAGAANTVVDALHIDTNSDGWNQGVAITMGLKNSIYGSYLSRIINYNNNSTTTATKLQLQTQAAGGTTWNTGILIDDVGRVGIATTTPSVSLQVHGNGTSNNYRGIFRIINTDTQQWGGISFPDGAASDTSANNYYFIGRGAALTNRNLSFHIPVASDYGSGSQPKFLFASTGADTLMTLEASTGNAYIKGNVGIGTTSPAQKLDIVGRTQVRSDGVSSAGIWYTDSTGAQNVFAGSQTTVSAANFGIYTNSAWRFSVGNSTGIIYLNEKEAFITDDTYLRINQSNTFSSGIWLGSSNIAQGDGKYISAGSNGGTTLSRIYIYGGAYNGINVINLDGSTGNAYFAGNVGIGGSPVSKLTVEGGAANWNETTPGTSNGTIHLDPGASSANIGNAITFGAHDSSAGATAQAGIYVRSDGSYGTKMYFATTDDYVSGSKTRMTIQQTGQLKLNNYTTTSSFSGTPVGYLAFESNGNIITTSGTGIGGSTGSTDNAILRADGTGGSTVQSSALIIDDDANLTLGTNQALWFRDISVAGSASDISLKLKSKGGGSVVFEKTATSNSIITVARTYINSTANPIGSGFGGTYDIDATRTIAGDMQNIGRIGAVYTDVTSGSIDSDLIFYNTTNSVSSEKVRIKSTGQLVLNNYLTSSSFTGTTAGLLGFTSSGEVVTTTNTNTIEEGNWTPTYVPSTGSFTSITYNTNRSGRYQRIGNKVYISGRLSTDQLTIGTGGGDLKIGGLPFSISNSVSADTAMIVSVYVLTWDEEPPATGEGASSTDITLYRQRDITTDESVALAPGDMTTGSVTNANLFYFFGWYTTNA